MILSIISAATDHQIEAAIAYTSRCLGVPESVVTDEVSVAYVVNHYQVGVYVGWEGFVDNLG